MPSTSEKQRRYFLSLLSAKLRGDTTSEIGKVAERMTIEQIKHFTKLKKRRKISPFH